MLVSIIHLAGARGIGLWCLLATVGRVAHGEPGGLLMSNRSG